MALPSLTSQFGPTGLGATCFRCMLTETEGGKVLSEIAGAQSRSVEHFLDQINRNRMPGLKEKAGKRAEKRLEEERQKLIEQVQDYRNDLREEIEQKIRELGYEPQEEVTRQDLEECLADYVRQGHLDWDGAQIKITSKGAKILASSALKRILAKLAARGFGTHTLQQVSYGSQLTVSSRKYEMGDEYYKVDFEKTLSNAFERDRVQKQISLKAEDFQVFDELHDTEMCAGIMIDESASMFGDKVKAATDAALALTELISREPKDRLKIYLFSSRVREIPPHEILNTSLSGGTTDIAAPLRAFRKATLSEKGEKQVYLITDTEPNTENGIIVGFKQATMGVLREALCYRQAGITLNIIMLDQSPTLKELASMLARKNQGRVFFTSPAKLGEVIIEDYLVSKKKSI